MILLLDNYDSFVYNLARYVLELGGRAEVVRSDATTVDAIRRAAPSHIIISPGPCTPAEAGISTEVVGALGPEVPILGVCLGHQCIGAAYGGRIVRARHPMHGKSSEIRHRGTGIFRDLPSPLRGGRYHSLAVDRGTLPDCLRVTAETDDGEIMGLEHREFPVHGVQFHPESILTEGGYDLLQRFLAVRAGTGE